MKDPFNLDPCGIEHQSNYQLYQVVDGKVLPMAISPAELKRLTVKPTRKISLTADAATRQAILASKLTAVQTARSYDVSDDFVRVLWREAERPARSR